MFSLAALVLAAVTAASSHLTLTPSTVEAHGTFGQSMIQALTLDNATPNTFDYRMEAEDVVVRNGKRVFVRAGELPNSIAATAVYSRNSGSVAPQTTETVSVRLTVPDRTAIRAVVITFRSHSAVAAQGGASLTGSLGALLTFTLTSDTTLEGDSVHVHAPTSTENLQVEQTLRNTGSEPLVPSGVAAFIASDGKLAAKIPFAEARLLPGEHAQFHSEYPGKLERGRYRVVCTFSYDGKTLSTEGSYNSP